MIYRDQRSKPPGGFLVEIEGMTVSHDTYTGLLSNFRKAIRLKGIVTGDAEALMNDLLCKRLPGGFCIGTSLEARYDREDFEGAAAAATGPKRLLHGKSGADARAWKLWHTLALKGELNSRKIQALVGMIGCSTCRTHATSFISSNPLDPTWNADQQFSWTVKFHNYVNRIIAKPTITDAQARAIWSN